MRQKMHKVCNIATNSHDYTILQDLHSCDILFVNEDVGERMGRDGDMHFIYFILPAST